MTLWQTAEPLSIDASLEGAANPLKGTLTDAVGNTLQLSESGHDLPEVVFDFTPEVQVTLVTQR